MASNLRRLRKRAGLTQPELAVMAGVNQTTISVLERGKIADPRHSTIRRIAKALGVSVDRLHDALAASRRGLRQLSPVLILISWL
jgi:transcriptional regulator with XRE-family HTH domain